MFNLFNCVRRGLFSRLASPRSRTKSSSEKQERVYTLPDPDRTLQPYRTMASSNKYNICLESGAHDPILVVAYLDSVLKSSLVSEEIARQTKAKFVALPESIRLEDDHGRRYVCDRKIYVSWYRNSAKASTFEEIFYVFAAVDSEIGVRLRADINAQVQEAPNLYILSNAKLTEDEKKAQEAYDKKERAKQKKLKEARRLKGQESNRSDGDNRGQEHSAATST
ncbi:hypothetical protein LTR84_001765 [Exophiala bonariae]|uniref:Uncharacterized protein n=1 Tax=Exophiala bonariae TaxID=1690606 RepID=A0AAV9NBI1_9EURO|nr:hypothetical protein LTR84_001765 [Exophiala bonariae]